MELLIWFQDIGNSFLDIIFKLFTFMGEEYFIMVVFCLLMWCGDKRFVHKAGFAFCLGMGLNQILKIIFCIQRPWVIDDRIKASSHAVKKATGYSFPSGHTQSGMTVFGCLAKRYGGKLFKIACVFFAIMVGVSRMYFRVHTPWDVIVSMVLGVLVIFATDKIYGLCERNELKTLITGIAITLLMVAFALLKPYPSNHLPEYAFDCIKIAGAIAGFIVGWYFERRVVKYSSNSSIWLNLIKTLISITVLLVIKFVFDKFMPVSYFKMYIQNFALLFWCIGLSPYVIKKLFK